MDKKAPNFTSDDVKLAQVKGRYTPVLVRRIHNVPETPKGVMGPTHTLDDSCWCRPVYKEVK